MRSDRFNSILALAGAALLVAAPAALQAQVHGPERFPGYPPSRCVTATRMIDAINRVDFRDSDVYSAERDTLFTATVESMRNCEGVYAAMPVPDAERLNAARVQRFTSQYDAALATERQHLDAIAARPVAERAAEMHFMVQDNLNAKPARLDRALELVAQMDALGTEAATYRTMSHFAVLMSALAHDDLDLMNREAQAVVDAWQQLDDDTKSWRLVWLLTAIMMKAEAEALVNGRDAALEAIQPLHALIPSSQPRVHGRLRALEQFYGLIGQQAQPIAAEHWYNTGDTGPVRPAPGRVSLILTISRPCVESNQCLSMMDATRRFEEAFGDEGLDITFRTQTWGFYADTAPAEPAREARYDSTYFVHEIGIPGALAVSETQYSFMPDGRRINEATSNDLNYLRARTIVVDRNGLIRFVAENWTPALERRLHTLIGELVREQPAAGGGAGP